MTQYVREYLDHTPFWNAHNLDRKLLDLKNEYNRENVPQGLDGDLPEPKDQSADSIVACLENYDWKEHSRGLYPLLVAA